MTMSLFAQNDPTYSWMKNAASGNGSEKITSFDSDNNGNIYCGGVMPNGGNNSYTHFNNGDSITSNEAQYYGGFLSKQDSNGLTLWAKDFSQGSGEGVTNVVVSPSQELYVASYTDHAVNLDGVSIPGRALYIFRYDLNGVLQSHVEFDVNDTFYRLDNLAVDQSGNSYISGFFNGSITFGATTISASNGAIFHVKVDISGNVQWIQQFSGRTWDIEVANDGNLLIAGNCPSSAQFGAFTGGSTNYQNPFLVKLNAADGTPMFLHTPYSVHGGEIRSIEQDEDDNIYVAGFFGKNTGPFANSIVEFGNFTISPIGENAVTGFIAKYSPTGAPIWGKTMGKKGQAHKIELRNDIITVRGEMGSECTFPNTTDSIHIRTFDYATYFATLDTSGLWLSARATSYLHNHVLDFLQTNTGSLYFTGWVNNTYVYNDGQDSIVSVGGDDGMIAKLNDISTVFVNAPSNLQVTGHGSADWNATTDISWTDNSNDEYGFFFLAHDQNGAPYGAEKVAENVTSGTVLWLWDGVVYDYSVYAHKYDMLSEPSNTVTDTAVYNTAGLYDNTLDNISISVYPNPSIGKVNVRSEKEIQKIECSNLLGEQLYSQSVNANQTQFDIVHLPKGVYLINIFFEEGVVTKRVVLD